MKEKIYTLFAVLCCTSVLTVRGQDTTTCNPGFSAVDSQHVVRLQAWDVHSNIQHSWRFGDGASIPFGSNQAFISHYYAAPGHYTVVHIIRDSLGGGCFDSDGPLLF